MTWIEMIRAGGPVMYPLGFCSLLVLAILIERAVNLRAAKFLDPGIVARVSALVEEGRVDRAIEVCRKQPGLFSTIVLAGLEVAERGEAVAREAIEDAGRHETARLSRYLGALGTMAAIAPLLGLLGTVLGMIDVFRIIAEGGGGAADLSGGISQALITTAFGLIIAIPALVAYNVFQARVDGIVTDLERESLRVLRSLFLGGPARVRSIETRAATGE
jgi:biopolymer transport protein ExbB